MTDNTKEYVVIGIAIAVILLFVSILVSVGIGAPSRSSVLSNQVLVRKDHDMKTLLVATLLVSNVSFAQDSARLIPKYCLKDQFGEPDARIEHNLYASTYNNDSDVSWVNLAYDDGKLYGGQIFWEAPGADSFAIYVRSEDSFYVTLNTGNGINYTPARLSLFGGAWQRIVVPLHGRRIFGIMVPLYYRDNPECVNELHARCFFGQCTAYFPAQASVNYSKNSNSSKYKFFNALGMPVDSTQHPEVILK